ncbi:MAG: glycosyltransferase family 39 protein, partial [Verrucomicrobiota bacterium]
MKKWVTGIGVGAVALAVVLAVLNLVHGNLNQDEGWYLYAAKMVQGGQVPYVDFAFTQGPLLPWVYSAFYPVVEKWGVAGGRLVTTLFGLLAGLLAAATAWRIVKKNRVVAFVAVLLLVSCNVYQSYFTTVVKTYALCSFFLMAGLYALTFKSRVGALACGALLALAAGTRFSAGIVLPITGIWLIFQRERRFDWVWFGIGGGLTLLAVFGPFFLSAFEQVGFGLFGYHAGRDPGGLGKLLVLKVGFISRFVQAYFLFTALALAAFCGLAKEGWRNPGAVLLWLCGAGISLVHLSAAFPYDDYQAIAYPVLAIALVVVLVPELKEKQVPAVLSILLLVSVAAAFSSPINQDWFVRGRDRIWWQFKEKSDLQKLREAAEVVRQNSPSESVLLTQDTYLAVESGRSVPSGMEMGPFCYYPDMPQEQADQLHLLNRDMLLETLDKTDAPVA